MNSAPHKPVLIDAIIAQCAPIAGTWLDGTFGAGGYSRALLTAGASTIIGIDRDPLAHELAASWIKDFPITLHHGRFSKLADYAAADSLDGIVLDIGVSSMQLDIAERGFSFVNDGPLDMRMSQSGPSAADLVNVLGEAELADILYLYGEERASRRIARAIVAQRKIEPLTRTGALADICIRVLPRPKPHEPHPATRTFQALRIAVNGELDELKLALMAAIDRLRPGGFLVVVTFHSLEDRIVKHFFAAAAGRNQGTNRHAPIDTNRPAPRLEILNKKPIIADAAETALNPRARSAKLRIARRIGAVS